MRVTKLASRLTPVTKRISAAVLSVSLIAAIGIGLSSQAQAAGLALDKTVSVHSTSATSLTSPSFTTTQPNELLVAFIGSAGPSTSGSQSFTSVTGAGLTWKLAKRANAQAGTAEVWTAFAPSVVTNVTVKATHSNSYYSGSMTVATFSGAKSTIGASAAASAATGAPTATLTSTQTGSWVWGTGNDWDGQTARTVGTGQTKVDEFLSSTGDTYWTQRQTNPSTGSAGVPVTINDTAPTNHRWNLASVEILPATSDSAAPTAPSTVSATATSATQVAVTWTASTDNIGVTGYNVYRSTTAGFTPSSANLVGTVTATTYNDTSLVPGSYYYVVNAKDAAGNVSPASNQAAVILADATAPVAPSNLSATVNNAKVSLNWTASTDNVGVSGYDIYRSTTAGFTPDGTSLVGSSASASYIDMSVPVGVYYYAVIAKDAAGNVSAASNQAGATVNPSDTTAPTAPGSLTASPSGAAQIALGWTTSTDDVAVTGYNIYRATSAGFTPSASNLIGTATTDTYTDTVTPGAYYYIVQAYDAAGNLSSASNTASATISDTAAPTTPTNVTATAVSSTQINLNWTASSDNVGVTGYKVYRNGALVATTTTTSYSNSGLTASTSYSFYVAATDAAGNVSTQSPTVNATTLANGSGTVIFDDQFNDNAVDTNLWSIGNRYGDASNNEKQCYTPNNVSESGGYLQIVSKVDSSCSGYAYTSGMVQLNTLSYTYGTLEYRAKQPGAIGAGAWPAQWLLGSNCQAAFKTNVENTGNCNWPQAGSDEIDISEFKTNGPTKVWQNNISGSSGWKTCTPTITNASTNWHTYQLVWKPGSLVWKVDGTTTCTQTQGVPSTPMFVIINTALGGDGGGTINNSMLPQTMQVDYIKLTQ